MREPVTGGSDSNQPLDYFVKYKSPGADRADNRGSKVSPGTTGKWTQSGETRREESPSGRSYPHLPRKFKTLTDLGHPSILASRLDGICLSEKSEVQPKQSNIVGQYVLGNVIGLGAISVVHEAFDTSNFRKVAIKEIRLVDSVVARSMRKEVQLLRMMKHPNIVSLYDFIEYEELVFVVLELVEGGQLLDYVVNHGPLTELMAKLVLQQLLAALDHLHQQGIIHRDVKLDNILIDRKFRVALCDMGLSYCPWLENDDEHLQYGTMTYTPPEALGKRNGSRPFAVAPAYDIWSAGVTLYAMLTGAMPFDDDFTPRLRVRIMDGQFDIPHHLSSECRDLLLRMLHHDPKQRIRISQYGAIPGWLELYRVV